MPEQEDVMQIYTMGFTQKTAEQFFEKIKQNGMQRICRRLYPTDLFSA